MPDILVTMVVDIIALPITAAAYLIAMRCVVQWFVPCPVPFIDTIGVGAAAIGAILAAGAAAGAGNGEADRVAMVAALMVAISFLVGRANMKPWKIRRK